MALECETEEAELPWPAWGSKILQLDTHTTQEVNSGDPLAWMARQRKWSFIKGSFPVDISVKATFQNWTKC